MASYSPADYNRPFPSTGKLEKAADFAYTLARIEWDTFNTLTFKNPIPKTSICFGMAWRWCRAISEISGVPYNRLLIALRGEFGEQKGRFHFHVLVGGTTARNTISLAHRMERQWRIIANNAIPDCRPYNRSLAGAEYISKCLGANQYELSKYNLADSVTLSRSVLHLIGRTGRNVERRCGQAHMTRRAGGENAGVLTGSSVPCISSLCDETAPAFPPV